MLGGQGLPFIAFCSLLSAAIKVCGRVYSVGAIPQHLQARRHPGQEELQNAECNAPVSALRCPRRFSPFYLSLFTATPPAVTRGHVIATPP